MDLISKNFPDLTEAQLSQYSKLEGLYKDWNSKINVISRKDIDALYIKHVLHSLGIAKVQPFLAFSQSFGCWYRWRFSWNSLGDNVS